MTASLRIGWIGTGVMGLSMASHLQEAGYPLTVYNRTKSKAAPLLDKGAQWARLSPCAFCASAAMLPRWFSSALWRLA